MYKIGVIGGSDCVIGFKALGLDVRAVDDAESARYALREMTRPQGDGNEYAIIYIEEAMAAAMLSDISKFKDKPTPAIILIPGRDGTLGLGQTALKEAVEKAVGSDIL